MSHVFALFVMLEVDHADFFLVEWGFVEKGGIHCMTEALFDYEPSCMSSLLLG